MTVSTYYRDLRAPLFREGANWQVLEVSPPAISDIIGFSHIRVPGCLARIPDPTIAQKEEGKKICLSYHFFVATNIIKFYF